MVERPDATRGIQEKKSEESLTVDRLSLQERVLARAMVLSGEDPAGSRSANIAAVRYEINQSGERVFQEDLTKAGLLRLKENFARDPKTLQAVARNNLIAVARDLRLNKTERRERLERYFNAYVSLIVKLDRALFPETPDGAPPARGVPRYIPDGLSDMGSDVEIDPRKRTREKIRVNKLEMFERMKPALFDLITKIAEMNWDVEDPKGLEEIKSYIIRYIATEIYNRIKYDHGGKAQWSSGKSVLATEMYDQRLGVCRHHALYGQVILQLLGITSRLLKCDFDDGNGFSPHAANLVRINGINQVLDITNPEVGADGQGKVFLRPVAEKDIDAIPDGQTWRFDLLHNAPRTYKKRTNMFYRLRRD